MTEYTEPETQVSQRNVEYVNSLEDGQAYMDETEGMHGVVVPLEKVVEKELENPKGSDAVEEIQFVDEGEYHTGGTNIFLSEESQQDQDKVVVAAGETLDEAYQALQDDPLSDEQTVDRKSLGRKYGPPGL